jgi:two-component system nitrogen regulation response regulator NtrX
MPSTASYALQPLRQGATTGDPISLPEGRTVLGRDAACGICLPDSSVSRKHVEIVRAGDSLHVEDLNSRNGIHVNGVPRKSASLRPGDELRVGEFRFKLVEAGSARPTPASVSRTGPVMAAAMKTQPDLEITMKRQVQLPQDRTERHRDTLYHVCYWLTEGFEEETLRERCLPLLQQSFDAEFVHYYSESLELAASVPEAGKRAAGRLAPFLAERFQQLPEASIIEGKSIGVHQRRVGGINYLVGPIRPVGLPETAACSFIVVGRPEEWVQFDAQDRVLMQAVCQLWARTLVRVREVQDIRKENAVLKQKAEAGGPVLLGGSVMMEQLRARAAKVAKTAAPVLIEGETGSGKEVVAHYIHAQSQRADAAFVKMNCASIPDGLIESELFGHVKGAFTDAKGDRKGKFEQANGGTLFLDEIGEMPANVQAKVLRALENGEIEKVGSEKVSRVDVRVVTATHRNLKDMAARREFREDLYYRLSVVSVKVPPLRDHLDDLDALADHFLDKFCEDSGMAALKFSSEALQVLKQHAWPGNVRELRNVVQRCAIEATGSTITASDAKAVL